MRSEQHDRLGDHAAHRVPEEGAAVPAEHVEQAEEVGREGLERVRPLVRGMAALAVAALVRGDDVPAELGERVEPLGEVLLGPGEAVEQEERPPARAGLGDRQADGPAVTDEIDGPLDHDAWASPSPKIPSPSVRDRTSSGDGTSMSTGWP